MFRFSIFVVFVLLSVPSQARIIRDWTYKELFDESDVVVIADASPPRKIPNNPVDEVYERLHTTLNIRVVLKGNVATKTIGFFHSREKRGNFDILNGRRLIYFRTEGRTGPPQYLLFLKRTSDGQYESVSGQQDPVDSIMLLQPSHRYPASSPDGDQRRTFSDR